jgi:uncharacterized protein YjiS (DUF1127 family)
MEYALRLITFPATSRHAGFLQSALGLLAAWRRRSRTRQQLATLDGRRLADLGLTRAQQRAEAPKWFWQV